MHPGGPRFDGDRWYHLTMQRDGDRFRGYVDGVLYTENPAGTLTDASNPIYFGRRNPGDGRGFALWGCLDDWRLYDGALDASSIADLSNVDKTSGPCNIPEPSTLGLVALGALALIGFGRRRREDKANQRY